MSKTLLDLPSMDIFPSYIEALKEGYRIGIQPAATSEEIEEIQKIGFHLIF